MILLSASTHRTRIDDPRLKEVLYKAFRSRLPEVMDQSQHASQSTAGGGSGVGNVDQQAELFLAGMDEWEKERESGRQALVDCYNGHERSDTAF